MIEMDRPLVVLVAVAAIVGLEIWRRTLRHRAAPWLHAVVLVLVAGIAGGVGWSQLAFDRLVRALEDANPAEKTSHLASGLSHAMLGIALGLGCGVVAFATLAVASWRARRIPEGGPVARTR